MGDQGQAARTRREAIMIRSPIERGEGMADGCHIGQVRKYTGEPYINHLAAVADLVRTVPHTPEMLAAAWLHDVLEDTDVTAKYLTTVFGVDVVVLVLMLTDASTPADGNRKRRKEIDRKHLAMASPEAKTIKLADLIDNSKSIIEYDPNFAKVYLKEMEALLEVLTDGNVVLYSKASKYLNRSII